MEVTHPTADWKQLHNCYYRKREVYSLRWEEVDLSKCVVASSPFGGAIALTRDEKKIVLVKGQQLKPSIQVFTSSGKLISRFPWESGRLIQMGWSTKEQLICVLEDGTILLYTVHGELLSQYTVHEMHGQTVIDCRIWGGGVVLLTSHMQLYAVYDIQDLPSTRVLADPRLDEAPTSWTIIEPQFTMSQTVEVLLANKLGSVIVVTTDRAEDQKISLGPFTKMSVSPTGKILACYTQTGSLLVVSTDFTKNLSDFSVKSKIPPQQLVWCGTDSVVLYWEKIVLMVGPYGGWIKYSYEEPLFLVPESDGVRVVTNSKCEFISRVPDVTESIFKIGSTSPAATLYDAYDNFEKKSPKADENIRSIKNELAEAVDECITAAGHEFNGHLQKSLLKAASFGKCFLDNYDPEPFVKMCRTLRVLNAIRHPEVGIPITLNQFNLFKIEPLLDRLANRHQHLLACRIADYLKVKPDRVLVHWACAKVKTRADDMEISNLIVQKFAGLPSISYADIAETALRYKRQQLALMLLDYEPRASDQVPLLLTMGQDELALNKAIESGDTDLVYMVLLNIKRARTLVEFFRIVRSKPFAVDLFISYSKQQDLELLIQIYLNFNQHIDIANIRLLQAYQKDKTSDRINGLEMALLSFKEGKDQFAAKATEEQIKLLLIQQELERDLNQEFVNLPLSDTLYRLAYLDQHKRLAKLRSDFKVPDKRFWWIKLKALADKKNWDELMRFAKEKKSPIGYKPFADACLEKGALRDAVAYIHMIPEPNTRVDMFVKIGYFDEAAEIAVKELKDNDLLAQIRNKAVASRSK